MEYLSLYDYLGKAAGNDLGKEVASAAYQAGLYPKDFLDFYFREPESIHQEDLPGSLNRVIDEDDLPF